MDSKQLQAFDAPGHWVDGNRTFRQPRRPIGSRCYDYAHVVIDENTRLAYVEIHSHDRGEIAAQVLARAAAWMLRRAAALPKP